MFKPCVLVEFEDEDPDLANVTVRMTSPADRSLRVIKEDEEALEEAEEEDETDGEEIKLEPPVIQVVEEGQEEGAKEQGVTEEEIAVLSKLPWVEMETFCVFFTVLDSEVSFGDLVKKIKYKCYESAKW